MKRQISVIGLGYVGLPVATGFGRIGYQVLGFDIDQRRISELSGGHDRTGEVEPEMLKAPGLRFSSDPRDLAAADFHIVTVPTPIDASKQPDLGPLKRASETIGRTLKRGDIVVYESTVYPGVTEDVCIPVLEKSSGLRWKVDFNVGYSPERINPGDKERRFDSILKIVSADTPETLEIVDATYRAVVKAGTHRAGSIKVAEFAKVLENTQRDINIALINEVALISDRLGIDTRDVLDAAGTKWNFLPFKPASSAGTASASILSTSPTRPKKWAITRMSSTRAAGSTTAWVSMSPTAWCEASCGTPGTAAPPSRCWVSLSRKTSPTSVTLGSSTS